MENAPIWEPLKEAIDKARLPELKVIFSEAHNRLDETIKSKEIYYQRSNSLLATSITLLSAIVAYLGSRLENFHCSIANLVACAIGLILIYVYNKSKNNLLPIQFDVKGTFPEKIFTPKYLFSNNENENEIKLITALIVDYQCRIRENISINTKASENYEDCLNKLSYIPIAILVICVIGAIFNLPLV